MKARQLRELSDEELRQKLNELENKLFNYRTQVKLGRLDKPHLIRETRRDIAKIKTIINERKGK